jgi:hypothetical protein
MTALLSFNVANRETRSKDVSEAAGDLVYFSSEGVLAAGGSQGNPLTSLFASRVGLPPGGTIDLANAGDLATEDSGMGIDLFYFDTYAGGGLGAARRVFMADDALGGDVSGSPTSVKAVQVDCPAGEQFPSTASKLMAWVDEAALPQPLLYFTYLDSSGLTQYYAAVVLTAVP